jgi:hypothetical protein
MGVSGWLRGCEAAGLYPAAILVADKVAQALDLDR